LKTEAGYQWTNKLEGMFKDVGVSKDLMNEFQGFYNSEKKLGLQLTVNVCTTGYWPNSKLIQCNIPVELATVTEKYKRFYVNKHGGHKLEWRLDQGLADVAVVFAPQVSRTLVVTTFQMMILLLFNANKKVTFQQICEVTGVPKFEISHHLLSLVHPAVKVLLKKPSTKALEDDHMFMVNPKYFNRLRRVVIPMMEAKVQTGPDVDEGAIEIQRRHQMDAAIVRVMKSRKTLKHPLLVAEVVAQLKPRFLPKPNKIKNRIEALIEQEYLERDSQDRSLYKYLA